MLPKTLEAALGLALVVAPLTAQTALADGLKDLHGRLELTDRGAFSKGGSLAETLGERFRNDFAGDLRLTWEPKWGNWDFSAHYVVSGDYGGGARLARAEAPLFAAPPPATWLDLTNTIVDDGQARATQRIDRLALGYTTDKYVVRVGRQALTWGAGKVFHPMDLVDPFAPNATDTEYKPGVDMAYLQWLFNDGSDLQFIAVPRAMTTNATPTWDASTFALHYHRSFGEIGTTVIAARDHGDWTTGVGLSGPLGGAVWNAEIIPTFEAGGATRISGLANISTATTVFGHNARVFAEYFHNGFGVGGSGRAYDTLPADLAGRLARGQVFNTSRDYLAGGMTVEWTPLLTLSPSLIVNLNDGSLYAAGEADWSLNDNTDFIAGVQVPIGGKGTEYGGLPVSGSTAPYIAPPTMAYVQLRRYF